MQMDNDAEYSGDILRQEQLEGLRRLVLPGLSFLLHNVLHTSEQFAECMKLADIVTNEQYKLYKVGYCFNIQTKKKKKGNL